jgi:nucleoside-diphosphate-sugar epimerase
MADPCEDRESVEAVINLAGVIGTEELWGTEEAAVNVNILGPVKLLKVCREFRAAYVGIETGTFWNTPYSISKRAAREWALGAAERFGQRCVVLRVMNVYGPGHSLESKIVPRFFLAALRGEPFEVHGDGTQRVDMVWSADVAEALIRAAVTEVPSAVIEVGSKVMTVLEFGEAVAAACGTTPRWSYLPRRPNDRDDHVADLGPMYHQLGFIPQDHVDEQLFATRLKEVAAYYEGIVRRDKDGG